MRRSPTETNKVTFKDINIEQNPDINLVWAFIHKLPKATKRQLQKYGYSLEDLFSYFMTHYPILKSGYDTNKSNFSTYLYACLQNKTTDIFKYHKRKKRHMPVMVSLEEETTFHGKRIPIKETIVDHRTEEPMPSEGVLQQVRDPANPYRLTKNEINAILETYEEGLTYDEQAVKHDISPQAIFVWVKKALEKIRTKIKRDEQKKIL